jgi:hypothetical protein
MMYSRQARFSWLIPVKKKENMELKEIVIDKEKDNILVRKKKYRERTEQLTEYLKTKDMTLMLVSLLNRVLGFLIIRIKDQR